MTHLKINIAEKHTAYPGEYVPSPLTMEELMKELLQPHEGASSPQMNVVETADAFTIEVAAPGLTTSDFLVSIQHNLLSVSVLHQEQAAGNKIYHRHEFNYCCFKKEIPLPDNIDTDFMTALYLHGILYVRLPKSSENKINMVERVIIY